MLFELFYYRLVELLSFHDPDSLLHRQLLDLIQNHDDVCISALNNPGHPTFDKTYWQYIMANEATVKKEADAAVSKTSKSSVSDITAPSSPPDSSMDTNGDIDHDSDTASIVPEATTTVAEDK